MNKEKRLLRSANLLLIFILFSLAMLMFTSVAQRPGRGITSVTDIVGLNRKRFLMKRNEEGKLRPKVVHNE